VFQKPEWLCAAGSVVSAWIVHLGQRRTSIPDGASGLSRDNCCRRLGTSSILRVALEKVNGVAGRSLAFARGFVSGVNRLAFVRMANATLANCGAAGPQAGRRSLHWSGCVSRGRRRSSAGSSGATGWLELLFTHRSTRPSAA